MFVGTACEGSATRSVPAVVQKTVKLKILNVFRASDTRNSIGKQNNPHTKNAHHGHPKQTVFLGLTFGFSLSDGFYMRKRGAKGPDFQIDAALDARNLKATGNLFFFDLYITDFRKHWVKGDPDDKQESEPGSTPDPYGVTTNDVTEKFAHDPMITIALSAYVMFFPNPFNEHALPARCHTSKVTWRRVQCVVGGSNQPFCCHV